MIKLAITVFFLGSIGWFFAHTYIVYQTEVGTFWRRLFAATKDSATLFWLAVVYCMTAIMNGIMNMTDFLGAPEVRQFVTDHFSPEIASGIVLVILFILTMARLRSK